MKHKCTFDGCNAETDQPGIDGWSAFGEWGRGINDGLYCPLHVEALEALLLDGAFDDADRDLKSELRREILRPVAERKL